MTSRNSFDFFDRICCVHLPESTDRWAITEKEYERLGILNRVEVVSVIPPPAERLVRNPRNLNYPQGMVGSCLSHVKALTKGYNSFNILVFEDDNVFVPETHQILEAAIAELPDNWDLLYLGGEPMVPLQRVSNHLARVTGQFFGAYAFAVNRHALPRLLDYAFDRIIYTGFDGGVLSEFGPQNNTFCICPPVCRTFHNRSTITGLDANYDAETDYAWSKNLL